MLDRLIPGSSGGSDRTGGVLQKVRPFRSAALVAVAGVAAAGLAAGPSPARADTGSTLSQTVAARIDIRGTQPQDVVDSSSLPPQTIISRCSVDIGRYGTIPGVHIKQGVNNSSFTKIGAVDEQIDFRTQQMLLHGLHERRTVQDVDKLLSGQGMVVIYTNNRGGVVPSVSCTQGDGRIPTGKIGAKLSPNV